MAIAAMHMAYLKPQKRPYQILAARHQNIALPAIRTALESREEKNCYSLYACAQVFIKLSFADFSAPESLLVMPDGEKIQECLRMVRGAFVIRDAYFSQLGESPFKAFLQTPMQVNPDFDMNPLDVQLVALIPELRARDGEIGSVCCQALDILRELFAVAATPGQTTSTAALIYWWPARVPRAFVTLVKENQAEALVVLAHYCVMLRQGYIYWFLDGTAEKMLRHCKQCLSADWIRLIEMPLKELNIED